MIFTMFLDHGMSITKDIIERILSFLGISFNFTLSPPELQGYQGQQSPVLPGSPALRPSGSEGSSGYSFIRKSSFPLYLAICPPN